MTITTVGAGIGASAAMVAETAYGAVVATPAWVFYEPSAVQPKKTKTPKQSSPLAAGRLVDMASRRVISMQSGGIELPFEWCQANHFNTLLNQISSTYAAGASGSQAANTGCYSGGTRLTPSGSTYSYTFTFRNSVAGRSAAWQLGVPTTDAILRQYDLLGAKPTKYAWSCKAVDFLTCATTWDGRVLEDPLITTTYQAAPGGSTQTPYTQASPSYTAATPYDFAEASFQIGSSATAASTAAAIDGVAGFDWSVENKLKVDRQYYGNGGLKDEPITNAVRPITGTITSDFLNKVYFADAFYSDTAQSIIVTFSNGPLTATTNAIQFVYNNVYLNDNSPGASNKDVVSTAFPLEALYDGTNEPLTVIVQTTDATV